MADTLAHDAWKGTTGGLPWMQRSLVHILAWIDPRILYAFAAVFIVPGYMLFCHYGYISQYRFFRQRFGQSWWRAFGNVYLNHLRFAQVIIDRFAVYGGRRFRFEIEGSEPWWTLEGQPEGFVQVSSHIGNYEMAGYSLSLKHKRMHTLVFSGETATVMENRRKAFTPNGIEMVSVSTDMSHIFTLNNALADGDIVSMPGDRVFGSHKTIRHTFFGAEADFPQGPFALAVARQCPVVSVFVMKKDWRTYQVRIRVLSEGIDPQSRNSERLKLLSAAFVKELEQVVRQYPTQWFNYYDFWQ